MFDPAVQNFDPDVYQAFMEGYVRRINEATLRVPVSGIKIGTAKYSRLAQINLKSGVITFSRFAIENVPERGRRYLVIHELSHVKEASHNKRFWEIVGYYEPNYRKISKALDLAFKKNVQLEERRLSKKQAIVRKEKPAVSHLFYSPVQLEIPLLDNFGLPANREVGKGDIARGMARGNGEKGSYHRNNLPEQLVSGWNVYEASSYDCDGGAGDDWADNISGIMFGGAEEEMNLADIWASIT